MKSELIPFENFISKIEEDEDRIVIHLNKRVDLILNSDFCLSVLGEIGVLCGDKMSFDGKEIYLNSRNCKQLTELKDSIIREVLEKIGTIEHEKKKELLEDFKKEIVHDILKSIKSITFTKDE